MSGRESRPLLECLVGSSHDLKPLDNADGLKPSDNADDPTAAMKDAEEASSSSGMSGRESVSPPQLKSNADEDDLTYLKIMKSASKSSSTDLKIIKSAGHHRPTISKIMNLEIRVVSSPSSSQVQC